MVVSEIYNFQLHKYDQQGIHKETGVFFLDQIVEWEKDFHKKFPHCFADTFFSNTSTMLLINQCLDLGEKEQSGMDLIDGDVDLDINLEMETYSDIQTIYAIGSKINENFDEPILLIVDDDIPEGTVWLKYLPEDDTGEEKEPPVPVESEVLITK